MPIYEYRRPDGSTFEIQQSFTDEALKKDPETGVPVQRVLHAPAVHFKGKGFYNTDYGTRNRERETAANKSSTATDSSSKDSSSKDTSSNGASSQSSSSSGEGSGSASKREKSKAEGPAKDSGKSKGSKPAPAKD